VVPHFFDLLKMLLMWIKICGLDKTYFDEQITKLENNENAKSKIKFV